MVMAELSTLNGGETECPPNAQLVYKGIAGGTHFPSKAGPANILCLPDNPEYGNYTPGFQADGAIYGTDYQTFEHSISFKHLLDHDVPCAVCRSKTKTSVIMVPAKMSCFPGWHVEYTGYLMAGHYNHASSEYLCVDGDAEAMKTRMDKSCIFLEVSVVPCHVHHT